MVGRTQRGELVRYDAKSGGFVGLLSGISAEHVVFSPDGKWVAYVKYPEGALYRSRPEGSERLRLTAPPLNVILPRWSPDGKRILFGGKAPGAVSKVYTISPDGGSPEPLMPNDGDSEGDPNWSPDGDRIVFAVDKIRGGSELRVFELRNHRVSTLPGSQGMAGPRWSPDGQTIAAVTRNGLSIVLFDFRSRQRSTLIRMPLGFPNWSKDGASLYFLRFPDQPSVLRIRVRDHKLERIADLKGLPTTGIYGVWLGLTLDDSPLLLRDVGSQDVYALDWQVP